MRKLITLVAAISAISLMIAAPVGAHTRPESRTDRQVDWAKVAVENRDHEFPVPDTDTVGWTRLVRSEDGLQATTFVRGLKPGGVYTFWWVAPYEFNPDGSANIPGGVFVARGAGRVIGKSGVALVRMRARTGQAGILGLPALEGALWSEMKDPLTSIVRVEIAYHGQADEAANRAELRTWLSDFWTGGEPCTDNPIPDQPHCPVYMASTFAP